MTENKIEILLPMTKLRILTSAMEHKVKLMTIDVSK